MSGGHFEYKQFVLTELAERIEEQIDNDDSLSIKTKRKFDKAVKLLKEAQIYTNRIDWLLSDDDGEDTFHARLKEDLEEFKQEG